MDDKELSFEELFSKLEKTIQTLEAGSLTLAESLSLFEEGMKLAKLCNEQLDAAELKINQLRTSFKEEG